MEEKKAPAAQPDPKKKAVAALVAAMARHEEQAAGVVAAREKARLASVLVEDARAAVRQLGLSGLYIVGGQGWFIVNGKKHTTCRPVPVVEV